MPTDQSRSRILLITRNLPPLVGGMERLMHNVAGGICEYAQLTVIGPKGSRAQLPPEVVVIEVSAKLVPFLLLSTWFAMRTCRRQTFDVVIGGSGLMAPALYLVARFFGRKTVVFLHGLDLVVDSIGYKLVFLPCIRRVDHVIANSRNTQQLALDRGVQAAGMTVINPGTDLPKLPSEEALANFRKTYDIRFEKVLIFVGRLTRRKGLSAFIRHCLPGIIEGEPTAGLVVVGENPNNSLNKLGEQEDVIAEVERAGCAQHVLFLGHLNDTALLHCYAAADVQILPLIHVPGDIEGFGMIAIEAAACGTPTIAFDLGGVSDAIAPANGHLVPPGNFGLFTRAALNALLDGSANRQQCIDHAKKFSWTIFNQNVKQALQRTQSQ